MICVLGIFYIKGGFGTIVNDVVTNHKFISGNDFNIGDLSKFVPLILAGQIFNSLYQYTGSQDVVQRYQTTATIKDTNKSMYTNGWLALITIPLFFGMGTILYSFYQHTASLPAGFNTSAVVPYFVITQMPAGVAGLVIAGIFAAAQSTIASSLNAISSCVITDFKQRFFNDKFKNSNDVTLARGIIILAGLLGLAVAIYLLMGNASQIWNLFLSVTGIFGVPIAGIFAVGIFTKRANTVGVLTGLVLSVGLSFWVQAMNISSLLVACVAFVSSFILSYVISLLFPSHNHDVTGLTVSTINEAYTKKQ
ncbi:sodium-coupled N-acetylneuraminate transporter [Lactiplantibacillus plantarum]|nr:sodium-coupled N-acetylneuraminate transporter [Lactiplantibacillus plantarum]